ncbi:hypothetical protein V9T40_014068 [Parthenolecanium corni]|uniref:Uncharacterized protein n=1 Tax=Parthenolecanium corni TaxID=536013 RepID=A0AAN9Y333_9HEMI
MDRWVPYYVKVPRWSKRCVLFVILITIFLILFGPSYLRYLFWREVDVRVSTSCDINPLILDLYEEADLANARIHGYPQQDIRQFVLFVGNGYIGLPLNGDFSLYLKSGRTFSLQAPYYPAVKILIPAEYTEQSALHYTNGIAVVDKCYHNNIRVSYTYFAHRTIPSILVQEITIKNAFSEPFVLHLERRGHALWDSAKTRIIKMFNENKNMDEEFTVISGKVLDFSSNKRDNAVAVSVVTNTIPQTIKIPAFKTETFFVFSSVVYLHVTREEFDTAIKENENKAISNMKLALSKSYANLKKIHIDAWNHLWNTGFSISNSKVGGALNGDVINATIYYVLSSTLASYLEETSTLKTKTFVTNSLSYVEGCYGGKHQTLEADNLWGSMETIGEINYIVNLWLLTLEKQGCYNLVQAGADGVIQAMVLSFGSFHFQKQHLEFNMHPSFLHRTYHFRRINYGNQTHVNVTVEVDENDKAMLYVALDRSDKDYYACDGGCLDSPVPLGPQIQQFPVKLTKPFTSILYITSDKQHMEELRHTLHVKEVAEAPAQERTMIIMHKHGHHLGGLPTFFWVAIFTLIVIFHLFLMKLIYNEYWSQDKYKLRTQDSHYKTHTKYRFLQ